MGDTARGGRGSRGARLLRPDKPAAGRTPQPPPAALDPTRPASPQPLRPPRCAPATRAAANWAAAAIATRPLPTRFLRPRSAGRLRLCRRPGRRRRPVVGAGPSESGSRRLGRRGRSQRRRHRRGSRGAGRTLEIIVREKKPPTGRPAAPSSTPRSRMATTRPPLYPRLPARPPAPPARQKGGPLALSIQSVGSSSNGGPLGSPRKGGPGRCCPDCGCSGGIRAGRGREGGQGGWSPGSFSLREEEG
jgi:hypothetical protein